VAAYSPIALSAALSALSNVTGCTVYIGNVPASTFVEELKHVHFGLLKSIHILPESCVFSSVLNPPQVNPDGIYGMGGGLRWIPWNFQMDSILFSQWSPYGVHGIHME